RSSGLQARYVIKLAVMSSRLQDAALRFNSISEAYAWLDSHTNYERRLDQIHYDEQNFEIEGFRRLLSALGAPQRGRLSIHIAGTRGKGSSAFFLEAMLMAAGQSIATYISPHIHEYRERIRINGNPVEEEFF